MGKDIEKRSYKLDPREIPKRRTTFAMLAGSGQDTPGRPNFNLSKEG